MAKIPGDLTSLIEYLPEDFTEEQLRQLDSLDWFTYEGNKTNDIFVSAEGLSDIFNGIIDISPPNPKLEKTNPIVKIGRTLHRWTPEDGFYHA